MATNDKFLEQQIDAGIRASTIALKSTAFHAIEAGIIAGNIAAAEARLQASARNDTPFYNPDTTSDTPDSATLPYLGQTFGLPIYGSVTFGNTDPTAPPLTWIDNNTGLSYTFEEITIASAICTCNSPKSIIKTNIQGRDGSIKEYIGNDDIDITIECVINMPIGTFDTNIMRKVQLMRICPLAIPVTNYYLNALGVNFVVIETIRDMQKAGEYSNIYLSIQACSDVPVSDILP